ncbi:hypothetical protein [Pelagimonas sp. KU-00592-HH]|uniref:hypothetical protein n=1 Tax=Pelagimonas sp. KU-00592-HH TaxID=3127651 RepID=UPI0033428077
MSAEHFFNFGTTYQRFIINFLNDTANNFFPSFDGTSFWVSSLFGAKFSVTIYGQNLAIDESGAAPVFSGTCDRMVITEFAATAGLHPTLSSATSMALAALTSVTSCRLAANATAMNPTGPTPMF